MTKTSRAIHLDAGLNAAYNKLQGPKTHYVSKALERAFEDPSTLARALHRRVDPRDRLIDRSKFETGTDTRTTIRLDDRVEEMLQNLANVSKLKIEHVLRLAMEAYLEEVAHRRP